MIVFLPSYKIDVKIIFNLKLYFCSIYLFHPNLIIFFYCFKQVVAEYERSVIFRLGRLRKGKFQFYKKINYVIFIVSSKTFSFFISEFQVEQKVPESFSSFLAQIVIKKWIYVLYLLMFLLKR